MHIYILCVYTCVYQIYFKILQGTDFLDVEIIKEDNRLLTDVFVKCTDTHEYLHAASCHVYHSKKSIPYNQARHFNRICSKNQFFDKRCNDLEV